MVQGVLLGYQSSDTVYTVATISLKHFAMIMHLPTSLQIVPLHQNNSAHGALGVRRLKHLRKTSAPWMHHRHHGDKRGHHCCIRCPDLPQNSPPAFNSPRFIGRKTPDQLMPNQSSAAVNRFFGKWFFSGGVAERSCSATLRVSQAEYVIHGDTIDGGGWLPKFC